MSLIQDIYDLTPMQENMLFHYLHENGKQVFHMQSVIRITGEINQKLLQESFDIVVKQNDCLRTCIVYKGLKNPKQVVYQHQEGAKIKYIDLSGQETSRESVLENYLRKDKENPFILDKGPNIKIALMKYHEKKYVLVLSFHHIIFDGWSMGVFYTQLFKNYEDLIFKKTIENSKKKEDPFKGYVQWLQSTDIVLARNYWKEYLQDLDEPGNRALSAEVVSATLNIFEFSFDRGIDKKLQNYASQYGLTINIMLEVAWGIVMQRMLLTDDIIFGRVISGRNAPIPDIERGMGLFINTVPVRVKSFQNDTVTDICQRVQNDYLNSIEYSRIGLSEIQAIASLKSDMIQSVMVFENFYVDDQLKKSLDSLNFEFNIDPVYETPGYNLNVAFELDKTLKVRIYYNPLVYTENQIESIKNSMKIVINTMLSNPYEKVHNLPIVEKMPVIKSQSGNVGLNSISEYFESRIKNWKDNIAVVCGCRTATYCELSSLSDQYAAYLQQFHFNEKSAVAVMAERSISLIGAILGILKAGHIYLPIDKKLPDDRKKYILKDSNCQALIVDCTINYQGEFTVIAMEEIEKYLIEPEVTFPKVADNSIAYMIYTSGTTGVPKGTIICHRGVVLLNDTFDKKLGININDRILQFANISFDASIWEICMAIFNGARLYILADTVKQNTGEFEEFLIKNEITVATLPPGYLTQLDSKKTYKLRYMITAGSETNPDLVNLWNKNCIYINAYGPTEDTVCTTMWTSFREDVMAVSIGFPIDHKYLYILDKHNNVQPTGFPGELCIGGEGLALGYRNRDDLTKKKFIPDPFCSERTVYKTGDLVVLKSKAGFSYLGRIDNQIKLRGYRIEPEEIEKNLLQQNGIEEAAVVVGKDGSDNQVLIAFYVSTVTVDTQGIRSGLMKYLPDYMIPNYFRRIDKMPYNINGKIDKKHLLKCFHIDNKEKKKVLPRNKTEWEILDVWEEVLKVTDIGIDDNFFELGGDSLKLIRIISLLSKKDILISFSDTFKLQTIRMISDHIAGCSVVSGRMSSEDKQQKRKFPFDSIEKELFDEYQIINQKITGQPVEYNYSCSAVQNVTLQENFLPCISIIPNVDILKKEEFEKILHQKMASHDLLRSSIIYKKNQNMVNVHKPKKEKISIPIIKISGNMAQYKMEAFIKEMLQYHQVMLFGHEKSMFNCFILKDSLTAILVFIANHAIFDAVSSNYLACEFEKDKIDVKLDSYFEYVDYLSKGPDQCPQQYIIDVFNLNRLSSLNHLELLSKIKKYERCKIQLNFVEMYKQLEFLDIIRIYRKILQFNFKDSITMCGILINSRSCKYKKFYNRVGEYLDVIPIDYGGKSDLEIENLIKVATEKDINFMSLSQENFLPDYLEIENILSKLHFRELKYPILNFINLLESYYSDFMASEETDQTVFPYWTEIIQFKTSLSINTFVTAGQKEELTSLLLKELYSSKK